jgi:hypothetical protein
MMAAMSRTAPDSQIVIPDSFVALFVPPGRQRPTVPWDEVLQRYELCEDTAQMLLEPARMHRDRLGLADDDVVHTLAQGLAGAESGLTEPEAQWVSQRLLELMVG